MKLIVNGKQVKVITIKQGPRLRTRKWNMTWEGYDNFINGEPVRFFVETSAGLFTYYMWDGRWRKSEVFDVFPDHDKVEGNEFRMVA